MRERWRLADRSLYEQLIKAYGEKQRRYHTLQHLEECFAGFDEIADLAEHPADVELANEERSAGWALSSTGNAHVHSLVMATRHEAVPQAPDEKVLVDVDLRILVPGTIYRRKRREILESFVARPTIYNKPGARAR